MTLTFQQKFKVSEFLRSNEERWKTEKPTYAKLSRIILEQTGVQICQRTLKMMCSVIGVTWEKPHEVVKVKEKKTKEVNQEFANRLKVLETKIDSFTKAIEKCVELTSNSIKEIAPTKVAMKEIKEQLMIIEQKFNEVNKDNFEQLNKFESRLDTIESSLTTSFVVN